MEIVDTMPIKGFQKFECQTNILNIVDIDIENEKYFGISILDIKEKATLINSLSRACCSLQELQTMQKQFLSCVAS